MSSSPTAAAVKCTAERGSPCACTSCLQVMVDFWREWDANNPNAQPNRSLATHPPPSHPLLSMSTPGFYNPLISYSAPHSLPLSTTSLSSTASPTSNGDHSFTMQPSYSIDSGSNSSNGLSSSLIEACSTAGQHSNAVLPDGSLSPTSPCGCTGASDVQIACPFCPSTSDGHSPRQFNVKPTDNINCQFAQHLIGHDKLPSPGLSKSTWECTWPGCRCQGKSRYHGRCSDYTDPDHPSHVADAWLHLRSTHFPFEWRCKCGKGGPFKSKNALNKHLSRSKKNMHGGIEKKYRPPRRKSARMSTLQDMNLPQIEYPLCPTCGWALIGPSASSHSCMPPKNPPAS